MPSFELQPFHPHSSIRIVGAAEVMLPASLRLMWWVMDPESQILWPTLHALGGGGITPTEPCPPDAHQLGYARYDDLWQHSCVELFIGTHQGPAYREINLTAVGAWNCYGFDSYRQPDCMPPRQAHDIHLLQLNASFHQQRQRLEAIIDLQPFFRAQQCHWNDLQLGVSSILKTRQNQTVYFALQHVGEQPDFHCRSSWTLQL